MHTNTAATTPNTMKKIAMKSKPPVGDDIEDEYGEGFGYE